MVSPIDIRVIPSRTGRSSFFSQTNSLAERSKGAIVGKRIITVGVLSYARASIRPCRPCTKPLCDLSHIDIQLACDSEFSRRRSRQDLSATVLEKIPLHRKDCAAQTDSSEHSSLNPRP